jgi:hypothetical protein
VRACVRSCVLRVRMGDVLCPLYIVYVLCPLYVLKGGATLHVRMGDAIHILMNVKIFLEP